MNITSMRILHGNAIATIPQLAEQFHVCDRTVRTIVREMEDQKDRYGNYGILSDGNLKRVNILAFTDYYNYRDMLKSKNGKKHVPPYNPQEIAKAMGFYTEVVSYGYKL
ncbi:hypothetical protein [Sellimonas catena]|uniref:DNA-binding protein n=2 Tax=Clostridia TaxID=186801 RepID=A0A9W6CDF7_9FIRM|nr:hypothetical protein [Sellimonas catena]GLG90435.1 hypothetical protein Selli2_18620 [Sellimonas catena]